MRVVIKDSNNEIDHTHVACPICSREIEQRHWSYCPRCGTMLEMSDRAVALLDGRNR